MAGRKETLCEQAGLSLNFSALGKNARFVLVGVLVAVEG